jgi:hypothetical protein
MEWDDRWAMSAPSDEGKRPLFRDVNERVAKVARSLDPEQDAPFEFFCECGDCSELVTLTLAAYDDVVAHGYVLAPGHSR